MYGHLKEVEVAPGQGIAMGGEIGLSGSSGKSTGPHLHYEERVLKTGETVTFSSAQDNYNQFIKKTDFIDPKLNELGFGTWDPSKLDRSQLTRLERVQQLQLSDDEFKAYKDQLAGIEAKGLTGEASYQVVSGSGTYLGRYQMGHLALVDAGFKDSAGNWTTLAREYGVTSNQDFLANPQAQDVALRRYADRNAEYLVASNADLRIGSTAGGVAVTGAGLLLASHNDRGSLNAFLNSDGAINPADGNGLAINNYIELGAKVDRVAAAQSGSPTHGQGHWEDQTVTDPMGGAYGGTNKVWIPDSQTGTTPSSELQSRPIDFGKGNGWDASASPTHQGNAPDYSSHVQVTTQPDGSVYRSSVVTQDAPNGAFKRGDVRAFETDPQGRVVYESIRHVEGDVISLKETERDPDTGEVTIRWTDSRTVGGVRFTRDHNDPKAEFRDANGRTADEREVASDGQERDRLLARSPAPVEAEDSRDPEDPHSAAAINGSDLESDLAQPTGEGAPSATSEAAEIAAAFSAALVQMIESIEPAAVPKGSALAAADGGIQTDGGLQLPSSGLPRTDDAEPKLPSATAGELNAALRNTAGNSLALGQAIESAWQTLGNGQVGSQGKAGAVISVLDQGMRLADGMGAKAPGASASGATVLGGIAAVLSAAEVFSHSGNDGGKAVAALNTANTLSSGAVYNSIANELPSSFTPGGVGMIVSALPALAHGDLKGAAFSAAQAYLTSTVTEAATAAIASAAAEAGAEIGSVVPVVGTIVGAVVGYLVGSIFGGFLVDEPPPPEGHTHFSLDAQGRLTVVLDSEQSGGGAPAMELAQDVLGQLQDWVGQTNMQMALQRGTDVTTYGWALNPFALPGVGFYNDHFTVETIGADGERHSEPVMVENLMRLMAFHIEATPAALLPAWEAATLQAHWSAAQGVPDLQASIAMNALHLASLTAEENADHTQQALHTLATAASPELLARFQASVLPADATTTLLHTIVGDGGRANERMFDADGDGFLERISWVSPGDALLAIDLNGDGVVNDGRELLTPGGSSTGLNNVNWLDANGDGLLDARDPGFGALRFWLDVNGDSVSQAGESLSMSGTGIQAIELRTGAIVWADGHTSDLRQQTQQAEASGVKLTGLADTQGHELDAGTIVENEGYAGTATWVDGSQQGVRHVTFGMHFAKSTGDWEDAADAMQHRHGGDVAASPVDAAADGAVSAGAVRREVVTTATVADVGDVRLASQGSMPAATRSEEATFDAHDMRIEQGAVGVPLAGAPAGHPQAVTVQSAQILSEVQASRDVEPYGETRLAASDSRLVQGEHGQVLAGADVRNRQPVAVGAGQIKSDAPGGSGKRLQQETTVEAADVRLGQGGAGRMVAGACSQALDAAIVQASQVSSETPAEAKDLRRMEITLGAGSPVLGQGSLGRQVAGNSADGRGSVTLDGGTLRSSVVFVPAEQTASRALQNATEAMIRSARDPLITSPLMAIAFGAGLVQWPALASTDEPDTAPGGWTMAQPEAGYTFQASFSSPPARSAPPPAWQEVDDASFRSDALAFAPGQRGVGVEPDDRVLRPVAVPVWASAPAPVTPGLIASPLDADGDITGVAPRPAEIFVARALQLQAPEVRGELLQGTEDVGLRIPQGMLLANDVNYNGASKDGQAALRIVSLSDASHGQVSLSDNGDVIFVPDADYHGNASFSYTVTDPFGLTRTGSASLELAAVNDLPAAAGESAMGDEDHALVFEPATLLANDRDPDTLTDGQVLSISTIGNAQHGQVSWTTDGRIRFVPDPDYDGPAQFSYTVDDGAGGAAPATIALTINPINDAPRPVDDVTTVLEDQPLSIVPADLLFNDVDVDDAHASLTIDGVGNARHGQLSVGPDGRMLFTPDADFHGRAAFDYVVMDAHGAASTATAWIDVAAVNDAPVTAGEQAGTREDVGIVFSSGMLLANDTDADIATDGDSLHISRVDEAQHGSVRLDEQGQVSFLPDADFNGTASFRYWVADKRSAETPATVSVDVAPVNDMPIAYGELFGAQEDSVLSIDPADLLANDTDVDLATNGQVLRVASVSQAQHGQVELLPGGLIKFTPDANFHGQASFDYVVSDGAGGTATAKATLQLAAVNDAPNTHGEFAAGDEDHELAFHSAELLANDEDADTPTDGDTLRIAGVFGAENGTVSLDEKGDIHFVPDADFNGPAEFSYVVADRSASDLAAGIGYAVPARVQLKIDPVNDAPVLVGELIDSTEDQSLRVSPALLLANDRDVDSSHEELRITAVGHGVHGTVSIDASGGIVFTPSDNYNGAASFDYTVSDGAGGFTTGTATLQVTPVNDAPTVSGERASAAEDQVVTLRAADLLANDTDVDNPHADLRLTGVSGATHGTVALNAAGDVIFTPEPNYNGPAQFTYAVSDGAGGSATGIAVIDFVPVNDAPTVTGESLTLAEDTVARFTSAALLANDFDIDNPHASLRIAGVLNAQGGVVALDATGDVVFAPTRDLSGPASFEYLVSDGQGGTSVAAVNMAYTPVNDAPIVTGERIAAEEGQVLLISTLDLLANDTDVDSPHGDLRITEVSGAVHGTVALSAGGQVVFTPDANFSGSAQFTYAVSDGAGGSATGTTTIDFAPVNDAPTVTGETLTLAEDTVARFTSAALLANDFDIDIDNPYADLRIAGVLNAQGGAVALDTTGDVVFTPAQDFFGAASFEYLVSDGVGGTSAASVKIAYTPVNDAPVVSGERIAAKVNEVLSISTVDLLANDSDVDNPHGELRVTGVSGAVHGAVALSAGGQVVFTPEANYQGVAQFSYTVGDGSGGESGGTVTLEFTPGSQTPENYAPDVVGESVTLVEDTVARFTTNALLDNDLDADGPHSALSISAVRNAHGGAVAMDGSGDIVFTPTPDFDGTASFDYVVSDGAGGFSVATVVMTYTPVNDAPIVTGERIAASADQMLTIRAADLLANDTDPDNPHADLKMESVGSASHGVVAMDANGDVTFTPDSNYNGAAQFTYSVSDGAGGLATGVATITFGGVNHAPDVVGETVTLEEDVVAKFTSAALLSNDSDLDDPHSALTVISVQNARAGAAVLNANGDVMFTPDQDFQGNASFEYLVSDGAGGLSTATVNLIYTPVNDAPVAVGEAFEGQEDQSVTFTNVALLANDLDVDNPHADLRVTGVSNSQHGTAVLDASGNVVFTPDADYNGVAQFSYSVGDGAGGAASATIVLHLASVNDAPAAQGEVVSDAVQDSLFRIPAATLLANDSDVDNVAADLSVGWVGSAANGTVSLDTNGDVVFTPTAGFSGKASFSYQVRDPGGELSPAVTAVIPVGTVGPVNHNPVAVDDQFITYAGSQMLIQPSELLGNDADPDGDALTISSVANPQHGTATYVNGVLQFSPDSGYVGLASFQYQVIDDHGGSSWGTAAVDVRQPNVVPTVDQAWISGVNIQKDRTGVQYTYHYTVELDMISPSGSLMSYQQVDALGNAVGGIQAANQFSVTFVEDDSGAVRAALPSFQVRVTDQNGNWTIVSIAEDSNPHLNDALGTAVLSTHVAPIVLDLNGDGAQFDQIAQSAVHFDLDGDGKEEYVAWADHHDGVLVFDANADRTVNGIEEFSFAQYQPGARTDLEGLRAFDSNQDGRLDAGDDRWSAFGVWQDVNGDGCSEASEFRTLDELDIAALALQSNGQYRRVGSDVSVMGEAVVTHTDGRTSIAADASFMATAAPGAAAGESPGAPAELTVPESSPLRAWDHGATPFGAWEAEIARRAHRFIDLANWSPETDAPPVTFVPSAGYHFAHQMLATPEVHEGDPEMTPLWGLSQRDPCDTRTFAQRSEANAGH